MWDIVDNPDGIALIESFYNSGKPVATVCHSSAVLHRVTYQGQLLVKGKRVTGFTNGEEAAVNLTHVYVLILVWLIFSGPGRYSVDGLIASRVALFGVER